jgi:hypothetical protein
LFLLGLRREIDGANPIRGIVQFGLLLMGLAAFIALMSDYFQARILIVPQTNSQRLDRAGKTQGEFIVATNIDDQFSPKGHSIIYGAALDKFTGSMPRLANSFGAARKASTPHIPSRFAELFFTAEEAKAAAAAEAIAWAKRRLVVRES